MNDTVLAFKERAGKPGGGKGILIADGHAFTLATNFNGAICYEKHCDSDVYVMSERQISMMVTKNVSNSIVSTDYKGSQVICMENSNG